MGFRVSCLDWFLGRIFDFCVADETQYARSRFDLCLRQSDRRDVSGLADSPRTDFASDDLERSPDRGRRDYSNDPEKPETSGRAGVDGRESGSAHHDPTGPGQTLRDAGVSLYSI